MEGVDTEKALGELAVGENEALARAAKDILEAPSDERPSFRYRDKLRTKMGKQQARPSGGTP